MRVGWGQAVGVGGGAWGLGGHWRARDGECAEAAGWPQRFLPTPQWVQRPRSSTPLRVHAHLMRTCWSSRAVCTPSCSCCCHCSCGCMASNSSASIWSRSATSSSSCAVMDARAASLACTCTHACAHTVRAECCSPSLPPPTQAWVCQAGVGGNATTHRGIKRAAGLSGHAPGTGRSSSAPYGLQTRAPYSSCPLPPTRHARSARTAPPRMQARPHLLQLLLLAGDARVGALQVRLQ